MKKFYDKLLLLLALLILIGGCVLYLSKSGEVPESSEGLPGKIAENPYQEIQVPESRSGDANWPFPEEQSTGWVYDVFTPPKIYIDPTTGEFIDEPFKKKIKVDPFRGFHLVSLARNPYRIQIQGFSGDRNKPEECVLFLFDLERQEKLFLKQGESNEASNIEVLKFVIKRDIDEENSNVKVTATATILDKNTKKRIKLVDGELLYTQQVTTIFGIEGMPEYELKLSVNPSKLPVALNSPVGEFTLKQINLEEAAVTVEKQASDDNEAEIRTLTPEIKKAPLETLPEEEPVEKSDEAGEFEFIF